MPLMKLDVPPRHKWRYWYFWPASLALHALFWGLGELDLGQNPEMRFFSPEPSLAVSLVASGASRESVDEAEGAVEPCAEVVSTKAEESTHPTVVQPRKEVRKKQASSPKTKSSPPAEPSGGQSSSAEKAETPGEPNASAEHGATVERTIGEGDAPSFARFSPPEYPHQARARNREGRVLLRVLVSEEGRAKEIEVLESSHPVFTKAARKSAQRSRYVPLMRQGKAQEVWVRIPFQFKLR